MPIAQQKQIKPVAVSRTRILAIFVSALLILGAGLAVRAFAGGHLPALMMAQPAQNHIDSGQAATGLAAVIDSAAGTAINGSYEGRTHAEIVAELKSQQVIVTDTLSSQVTFTSGKRGSSGCWMVENIGQNNVIQQAELYLGSVCVARTAPLQPGQHVESITLIEDVPAGTQEVIAYVNYFHRDTRVFISRAGFNIKMTVSN